MAGDVPALALAELRRVVVDPVELDKGVRVLDQGGLAHLSRHGARLYAEADGAGLAPYRVSVAWGARGEARARCTCMAARSRPFCKHAAAVLVAWAQAPASFAVAEGPPPGEPEERRLRDLIRVLPHWPRARYLQLAPRYWAATRERLEPTQLAAAGPPPPASG